MTKKTHLLLNIYKENMIKQLFAICVMFLQQ